MRRFFLCFLLCVVPLAAGAQTPIPDHVVPDPDTRYYVRLLTGDVLTGIITELVNDRFDGDGLKLKTGIGTATIYMNQIAELYPLPVAYSHAHRVFIMPTAEPIGDNLFVGLYELLVLYGGIGFYDLFSFTAGRSFVPTIPATDQATILNGKVTVFNNEVSAIGGNLALAAGVNYAWQHKPNSLLHLYGVGTWRTERTLLTGTVFVKAGGADEMTLHAGGIGSTNLRYAGGTVGLGLGFDARITQGHYDLRFISELWNHEALNPDKVALLAGLRLWNTDFSADFGLMFFSAPGVVPVANFIWTPRIRNL